MSNQFPIPTTTARSKYILCVCYEGQANDKLDIELTSIAGVGCSISSKNYCPTTELRNIDFSFTTEELKMEAAKRLVQHPAVIMVI